MSHTFLQATIAYKSIGVVVDQTTAKARIQAAEAQIQAATIALNGVREEAKVGQRTTLDVLITDQDLLSARVNLVAAQRDRVVIHDHYCQQ